MLQFFTKKHHVFTKKHHGFTLIELLVVVAIIGLLASVVMVAMGPARARARDSARKSALKQIQLAMEMCYDDPGCGGKVRYCETVGGINNVTKIGGIDLCNDGGLYLDPVPFDPRNAPPHQYMWIANSVDQTRFCVHTRLETVVRWAAASHKGTCFTLTAAPTALSCWADCPR